MKLSRDSLLGLALIVVLLIVAVFAAVAQPREERLPALSTRSNDPEGARALVLWLRALEYAVDTSVSASFGVPSESEGGLIMMLEPSEPVSRADLRKLESTLEDTGGTLLIAADGIFGLAAFEHFGFSLTPFDALTVTVRPVAPLFTSPPLTQPVETQARFWLDGSRAHAPLLAAGDKPVAVAFPLGRARVILSTLPFAFANAGLKQPGHAELALNLIGSANARTVWFDEWHHGDRANAVVAEEILGPEAWLQRTPAGNALLYSAVVIFVALALRGQRFGRPVPLPRDLTRRAPLEYITALANLSRRAGHRAWAAREYSHRLKRQLGKRYRLDPTLRDPEFVARLALYRPELERAALTQLLERLGQASVSEAELIRLAGEVAGWMKE
jgi:hypothetical protein